MRTSTAERERDTGLHGDPDGDVLDLVREGNMRVALRRLHERHGAAIYRYCRDALGDRALADDVQQQVFLQAHRDLARFVRRGSVRTWLFAIARNRVLDASKARRRAHAYLDSDSTGPAELARVPDPRPSPGDSLDDRKLRQALIDSIDELEPRLRTALLLRYQQGFTFEQMSEICGEKPATLAARVTRALPKLREAIESRVGRPL
jgi:RNA polymerase sigma-70 factor, ECF subfamily